MSVRGNVNYRLPLKVQESLNSKKKEQEAEIPAVTDDYLAVPSTSTAAIVERRLPPTSAGDVGGGRGSPPKSPAFKRKEYIDKKLGKVEETVREQYNVNKEVFLGIAEILKCNCGRTV